MTAADVAYEIIERTAIVAGMRGDFGPETALKVVETLVAEDIRVFEFTMNSTEPIEAMQAVKREHGDGALVGMGTVLSVDDAQRVLDAGADFIVSPAFQPEVVKTVQAAGVLMAPGIFTPTEAVQAWALGVPLLKVFPIGVVGVNHFKALFGPLNHMRFMCNGAMDADNAREFILAGATAAGMGSWLTGDGSWTASKMRSRAHILRTSIDAARSGEPPLREA